MEVIYKKCCGVDIHKKVLAVCLMSGNIHFLRVLHEIEIS